MRKYLLPLLTIMFAGVATTLLLTSCARMGNPDGGWYDETPPRVIGASPADKGVNARSNKVRIFFNEFVKIENAQEKVVVSPPQLEQPDIKTHGRGILVNLKDSLKDNTTYTIDFSDAITDNNEGNPLGNYTYSFSTGDVIDTLEVSGTVLNAEDLEPIKGILVGLYAKDNDSVRTQPMLRVSRTDSQGRFVIRGIAPGEYRCYALQDMDGNYMYSQKSEQIAFNHDIIVPTCREDIRQDTIWTDTLHIKDITRTKYTHFYPDNIVLRAFTVAAQDRYFLKAERLQPDRIVTYFTGPGTFLPTMRLMDGGKQDEFGETVSPFYVESTEKFDTITYWIRDTALVNRDTLNVEYTYEMTDTLGNMIVYADTLEILSKVSYAKRMKEQIKRQEEWDKQIAKRRKKGEEITDSIMPGPKLEPKYAIEQNMSPDGIIGINFPSPIEKFDTAAIHLYAMRDSMWFRAPFDIRKSERRNATDRNVEIIADWLPDTEYSFEVDTLAFTDIYGLTSDPFKTGFKVQSLDEFTTLFVNVSGIPQDLTAAVATTATISNDSITGDTLAHQQPSPAPQVIVQMLDGSGKVVKEAVVADGTAEFYYLKAGTYYLRAITDRNGNGVWDTGDYDADLQPEEVFYCPEPMECKAKWDGTRNWNLTSRPLDRQKPGKLIKQKADKKKTIRNRNAELARQKGIPVPEFK